MAVKRRMKMYVSLYCTFLYFWEDDDDDDQDSGDDYEEDDDNDDEDDDDDIVHCCTKFLCCLDAEIDDHHRNPNMKNRDHLVG